MKCNNCGKEIIDYSHNYCVKCGEKISDSTDDNIESNFSNEASKIDFKEQIDSSKEFIKKNKKMVAIIGCIVGVIIIAIIAFSMLSGRTLSASKIKENLIGKSIYIGGADVLLSDDSIKDIEVINRETVKKESDLVKLQLELDLNGVDIKTEYTVHYYYDDEWVYSDGYMGEIIEAKPEKSPEDALKESIKEITLYSQVGNSVSGEYVKEISNISMDGNGLSNKFTADILLSNGVISQVGKIKGTINFSIDDLQWKSYSVYITELEDIKVEEKIDDESLKESLKKAIGGSTYGTTYYYKYKDGETEKSVGFSIGSDVISEISIKDTRYIEDKESIRVELSGKVKDDKILKELSFSGTVSLKASFNSYSSNNIDIKIDSVELEYPTIEFMRESILDADVDGYAINTEEANSFVEDNRNVKRINFIYINGKISINGEVKEIQLKYILKMKDGKYVWNLYGVYSKGSYGYTES